MSRNREEIEQELERMYALENGGAFMDGVRDTLSEELRSLGRKMANNWFENSVEVAYVEAPKKEETTSETQEEA